MKRSLLLLALLAGTSAAVAHRAGMLPGVDKAAISFIGYWRSTTGH